MKYTVINANEKQQKFLLEKHLKFKKKSRFNFFNFKSDSIISKSYSYNSEDDIGFISLNLATGKICSYQLRGGIPCFVEFKGFDSNIRYDIYYPEGEIFEILKKEGVELENKFWNGINI